MATRQQPPGGSRDARGRGRALAGRLAVAGAALALLAIAALSLWSASEGERAGERVSAAAEKTAARVEATNALSRMYTRASAYEVDPTPERYRELQASEQAILAALARLAEARAVPSELTLALLPQWRRYREQRQAWLDAVERGDRLRAERIEDVHFDPLLADVQELLDQRAPGAERELALALERFASSRHLVTTVTKVAVPIGLALLLLCGFVLRGFRRRGEEHQAAALERSQRDATTDALTGLWNRRKLQGDLARALAGGSAARPRAFALLDLDGFKGYNDKFGHPAGDALLHRLAGRLAAAVGRAGEVYRVGGDEFCVLLEADADVDAVLAAARAAVRERGEAFEIDASWGRVELPREAETVDAALLLADQRMYAAKGDGRQGPMRQARDVLFAALVQRDPELGDHLRDVAALARRVGQQLGLAGKDLEELVRAAELHDIGKVAIPDELLDRAGPLDADEWDLMRQHAIVGERILRAAPAMVPVARIVRSARERWDGGGYPDGLSGAAIPLAARIVCACSAYESMVSGRAYRSPMSSARAVAELGRGAGAQFDPAVVAALVAALERGGEPAAAEPAARV